MFIANTFFKTIANQWRFQPPEEAPVAIDAVEVEDIERDSDETGSDGTGADSFPDFPFGTDSDSTASSSTGVELRDRREGGGGLHSVREKIDALEAQVADIATMLKAAIAKDRRIYMKKATKSCGGIGSKRRRTLSDDPRDADTETDRAGETPMEIEKQSRLFVTGLVDPAGTCRAGEGTCRAGEGTCRAGEGTCKAGEGTCKAGEGTCKAPAGECAGDPEGPDGTAHEVAGTCQAGAGTCQAVDGTCQAVEGTCQAGAGTCQAVEGTCQAVDGTCQAGAGRGAGNAAGHAARLGLAVLMARAALAARRTAREQVHEGDAALQTSSPKSPLENAFGGDSEMSHIPG